MQDEDLEVDCFLTYFFPEKMDFNDMWFYEVFEIETIYENIFEKCYDRTSVLADEAVQLLLLSFIKCRIT